MKISIFGLGYVGTVSGACLVKLGHNVIGVDHNSIKVDLINKGMSPVIERDLPELISAAHRRNQFFATQDAGQAILNSDISLICVGTPSNPNGSLNLDSVIKVCKEIGKALKKKKKYHRVVLRSTVLPGSTERVVIPALERSSGSKVNNAFGVCVNPEFMREGNSIHDFLNPPFTLIGSNNKKDARALQKLYQQIKAPIIHTDYRIAEMIKYVSNAFHALKITFANEIGAISKKLGIDGYRVMEIFSKDTKLNISTTYLKPGFAFGGSCLPKDLKALLHKAKNLDVDLPLLNSIFSSNQQQIQNVLDLIIRSKKKKIGLVGLSFKAGTDDLRESPFVVLSEYLIGKGYTLRIFDENVFLAKLIGSNKGYIEKMIPHISSILTSDINDLINNCELIIVGNYCKQFVESMGNIKKGQVVVDLARISDKAGKRTNFKYQGIFW